MVRVSKPQSLSKQTALLSAFCSHPHTVPSLPTLTQIQPCGCECLRTGCVCVCVDVCACCVGGWAACVWCGVWCVCVCVQPVCVCVCDVCMSRVCVSMC